MLSEKGKNNIQIMIRHTGTVLSNKREELDALTIEGEDKISTFMEAGEIPPEFNDPNLRTRYNLLLNYEKELNRIQSAHIDSLGQISSEIEETYINNMQKQLNELESRIAEI